MALGALVVSAALVLSGCSAQSGTDSSGPVSQSDIDKAMSTPTTITFWTWVGDFKKQIAEFNKKYPKITVNVVNVGSGQDEYTKLRAAIKSGKGAPDLAQVGYDYIPSFNQTKSLADLTPYGAAKLKSKFTESSWSLVANSAGIWSIPQDTGPMGTLYRSDIFKQAGLDAAPATWADFATAAETVKAKTGAYITNFPGNDMSNTLGFFWQAGAKPFTYDGKKTVGIDVDSPAAQKIMDYWQPLIDKNLVATDPDFNDAWYQGLNQGKYATWLTAAWGPLFLTGSAKDTSGKWTAGKLPQWKAGDDISGNWGGSTDAVLALSKNKIPAYEFSKFLNSDPKSALSLTSEYSLFPPTTGTLKSTDFTDASSDFFAGQKVNAFFSQVSTTVDSNFEYLPFMDYADSSFNSTIGKAITNHTDLKAGLAAWQKSLVDYAKQQGFTVK
jgi:multiple sugar transport system substrate-binding protein